MSRPTILDERFLVHEDQIGATLDFRAVFGNDHPVEIEIGTGKGTLMLYLARTNPDHNFLGIEWASKFYRFAADRFRRWNLTNTRMLRTDARELVLHKLAPDSVFAFHVYFPDPWPKKKHHRRRLFIPDFCRAAARVLVPGGKIYVASDHEEYFREIEINLYGTPGLREADFDSPAGNQVLSNYEAKFTEEGRKIYRLAVRKE